MRVSILLLALLCVSGCADDKAPPVSNRPSSATRARSTVTNTAEETAGPSAQPQRPDVNEGNVTITRPLEGAVAEANPIHLEGTARTFENNVVIEVLDSDGDQILQTSATAQGDLGNFNPWAKDLWLTEWPGESLTIRALEYSAKDGTIRSFTSVTLKNGMEKREVSLYFPNTRRSSDDCSITYKVNHIVPGSVAMARLLTEALIAGPTRFEQAQGFSSEFPRGALVDSIDIDGSTVIVDFSPEMQNVGGSCRVQAIRTSMEKTLTQLPNIDRVTITAGGSEPLALQP